MKRQESNFLFFCSFITKNHTFFSILILKYSIIDTNFNKKNSFKRINKQINCYNLVKKIIFLNIYIHKKLFYKSTI